MKRLVVLALLVVVVSVTQAAEVTLTNGASTHRLIADLESARSIYLEKGITVDDLGWFPKESKGAIESALRLDESIIQLQDKPASGSVVEAYKQIFRYKTTYAARWSDSRLDCTLANACHQSAAKLCQALKGTTKRIGYSTGMCSAACDLGVVEIDGVRIRPTFRLRECGR